MKLSRSDRDEVLTAFQIELQGTFAVLTSAYSGPAEREKAAMVAEIEEKINECLSHMRVQAGS